MPYSIILLINHGAALKINYIASVSWSSASLMSSTVWSRMLLTRPSTSGESDQTIHACRWMFWMLILSLSSDWKNH